MVGKLAVASVGFLAALVSISPDDLSRTGQACGSGEDTTRVKNDRGKLWFALSYGERLGSLPRPFPRDSILLVADESVCDSAIAAHNALYPPGDPLIVPDSIFLYRIGSWGRAVVHGRPSVIEFFRSDWTLVIALAEVH